MPQMGPMSWMLLSLSLLMGAFTLSYSLSSSFMVNMKVLPKCSPLPTKLPVKW